MCVTKIKVKTPNYGCAFNIKLLESVFVSQVNVSLYVEYIKNKVKCMNKEFIIPWLIESVRCIDLTTLGGDDTPLSVQRLCYKAVEPIPNEMLKSIKDCPILQEERLRVAAVCVYPSRLSEAVKIIDNIMEINNATEKADSIQIASVAAGFPSGQYPLSTRLDEIKHCVKCGATEIDVVINRTLVLIGDWEELYNEIRAMKEACGDAKMKTILGVGECGSLTNVYKASLVAMMAGSDFIKTSTGKEAVNATLPVGIVMCRAIWDYYFHTGYGVGLKPAGGIKTVEDMLQWKMLVTEEFGNMLFENGLFRIGASGVLDSVVKTLCEKFGIVKSVDGNYYLFSKMEK